MITGLRDIKMNKIVLQQKKGQTAVEYLLILGAVMIIVLIGLRTYLPRAWQASDLFFNRAGRGVLGPPSRCGDGNCEFPYETRELCCQDCRAAGETEPCEGF